jgi:hypothetical protein
MHHLRLVGSALGALVAVSASPAQAPATPTAPAASISTMISSSSGMRRVRANFHLDRDAYVVVGHIDADGEVRIVYPSSPSDSGFVRADKAYHTDDFFAGFNAEYRARARDRALVHGPYRDPNSYDGGLGYVFLIASSHPMRTDSLSANGKWNTYELDSQDYLRDPRPDVKDLASQLGGDDKTAYSVNFAPYYTALHTNF